MSRYLSVKEVAALLKVSVKTVYKKKRDLPGYFCLAGLHFFDEEIFVAELKKLALNSTQNRSRTTRHGV